MMSMYGTRCYIFMKKKKSFRKNIQTNKRVVEDTKKKKTTERKREKERERDSKWQKKISCTNLQNERIHEYLNKSKSYVFGQKQMFASNFSKYRYTYMRKNKIFIRIVVI